MVKLTETTKTAKDFAYDLSVVLEQQLFRNTDNCPRREKIQRVIETFISNHALEAVGKERIAKAKQVNYMEDYRG